MGASTRVNASVNLNLGPLPPTGGPAGAGGGTMMMGGGGGPVMFMMARRRSGRDDGPRFVWNRGLTLSGFYTYGQNYDNSDGAFVIPSTIFLADQWGPTAFDRRHNTHIAITSTALSNLTIRFGVSGSSAPPLTIRTRPTTTATWCSTIALKASAATRRVRWSTSNTSANFGYSFTLGKKTVTSGGGVQIMGAPAGLTVNPTARRRRRATG